MANSQLLDILLIAMVAGIILFRLYSVLGRRTGHERPPQDSYRLPGADAKLGDAKAGPIAALPDHTAVAAKPADPVARGLLDIKLADKNFDTDHFISGARGAYEIIAGAFASGDRPTLRPLLSDEVYAAFDADIKAREERREKISYTFVSFRQVRIVEASLAGRTAEITVAFDVQFISATANEAGAVIAGDPGNARSVSDLWTFARDVRARDHNWTLVATSGDLN